MSAHLFDNPAIGIPLTVGFLVMVVYFNRCPRCKRWFSLKQHTRKEQYGGKTRSVTTGWSCSGCGASAKDLSGLKALPPEPVVIPDDVLALPIWHPRSVWVRYRWKGLFGGIFGVFALAFVAFDPEVLRYPSYFPSYLESFADFLSDPFHQPRKIRTEVRVAGGSWKRTRFIERCSERLDEGWLKLMPPDAVVVEQATRSWQPAMAREGLSFEMAPVWAKYRRLIWTNGSGVTREGSDSVPLDPELSLPPVSEMAVGATRPGMVEGEYAIDLQDLGSQEIFRVRSLMLLRRSDRHHRLIDVNDKLYRALRLATDTWKARITIYRFGGEPSVRLYVEDLFAPPWD